jgi:hypothetical protein
MNKWHTIYNAWTVAKFKVILKIKKLYKRDEARVLKVFIAQRECIMVLSPEGAP